MLARLDGWILSGCTENKTRIRTPVEEDSVKNREIEEIERGTVELSVVLFSSGREGGGGVTGASHHKLNTNTCAKPLTVVAPTAREIVVPLSLCEHRKTKDGRYVPQ